MILNWKKGGTPTSKEGLGQPITDLAPDAHGTAYADWGIFCLDVDCKATYKDGTRQYQAFLYTKFVDYKQTPLVCIRGYLADAIKAVEERLFSKEYELPAKADKPEQVCTEAKSEVRRIDGYVFRINTYDTTIMVEIPTSSCTWFDEALDKLARYCAKLVVEDGWVITSVTEVHRANNGTPRVPVLTSKAYKTEVKRLMDAKKEG